MLTAEQLKDIRDDAEFTSKHVGSRGSPVRARAMATLALLDEVADLRSRLAVLEHPATKIRGVRINADGTADPSDL